MAASRGGRLAVALGQGVRAGMTGLALLGWALGCGPEATQGEVPGGSGARTRASALVTGEERPLVTQVVERSGSGTYTAGGRYDPTQNHYFAGSWYDFEENQVVTSRNFFVFDLAQVSGRVVEARLKVTHPAGEGPAGLYTLHDVTTSVDVLLGGGVLSPALHPEIWEDLGTGTSYAGLKVDDPRVAAALWLELNADALADLQARLGERFALGGHYAPEGDPAQRPEGYLFGNSQALAKDLSAVQLVLTVDPTADLQAPDLSGLKAQVAEATQPGGAEVALPQSVPDATDGSAPLRCTFEGGQEVPAGHLFPLGSTTLACSATDQAGNTAEGSLAITVVDTTPPALGPVESLSVAATGAAGAIVSYPVPRAEDRVQGLLTPTCSPAPGSLFPAGATPVTCAVQDGSGNEASRTFTVRVDPSPPTLSVPTDLVVETATPGGMPVSFLASAVDDVDGPVAPSCSSPSGSLFPEGRTQVTCEARDAAGNVASASFTVTVRFIDPLPRLEPAVMANLSLEASGPDGALVHYSAPVAFDALDGSLPVRCSHAPGTRFGLGTTRVSCAATNSRGKSAQVGFDVDVRDTTPPDVTVPADIKVVASSAAGAYVRFGSSWGDDDPRSPSASDLVEGSLSPVCTPHSGSLFKPGTTTVTCSARDAAGNSASASFRVSVVFSWSGLLRPVNADGSSIFRLGRTVPVKFVLTGASWGIGHVPARLVVTKVSDQVLGSVEEADHFLPPDEGDAFRYSGGQYVFNLPTRDLTPGTWLLHVDLGDGVSRATRISLR